MLCTTPTRRVLSLPAQRCPLRTLCLSARGTCAWLAHLEDKAVLAGRHGPHKHRVQHLVVLLAVCAAHVRQLPLQVWRGRAGSAGTFEWGCWVQGGRGTSRGKGGGRRRAAAGPGVGPGATPTQGVQTAWWLKGMAGGWAQSQRCRAAGGGAHRRRGRTCTHTVSRTAAGW